MKAYVMTSGIVFGLLVLAHIARVIAEGMHAVRNPIFLLSTFIAAALATWAWRVYRRLPPARTP